MDANSVVGMTSAVGRSQPGQDASASPGGRASLRGGFRLRVFDIDPQFGSLFPVGDMQGYLNLKVHAEFAAENRAAGWNT